MHLHQVSLILYYTMRISSDFANSIALAEVILGMYELHMRLASLSCT